MVMAALLVLVLLLVLRAVVQLQHLPQAPDHLALRLGVLYLGQNPFMGSALVILGLVVLEMVLLGLQQVADHQQHTASWKHR